MKNLGSFLLGLWLIVTGLLVFRGNTLYGLEKIVPFIAIAAGIFLFIEKRKSRLSKDLGILLLIIWLIVSGTLDALSYSHSLIEMGLTLLGIIAGILIILKK